MGPDQRLVRGDRPPSSRAILHEIVLPNVTDGWVPQVAPDVHTVMLKDVFRHRRPAGDMIDRHPFEKRNPIASDSPANPALLRNPPSGCIILDLAAKSTEPALGQRHLKRNAFRRIEVVHQVVKLPTTPFTLDVPSAHTPASLLADDALCGASKNRPISDVVLRVHEPFRMRWSGRRAASIIRHETTFEPGSTSYPQR